MPILSGEPGNDELAYLARQMQDYAREHPVLVPTDALDPGLSRMIGEEIRVTLSLELNYKTPRWHGSICGLHVVGTNGDKLFGLPEFAILNIEQWSAEQRSIANEILGYLFADLILDKHQQVQKLDGLFGLHWISDAPRKTLLREVSNG